MRTARSVRLLVTPSPTNIPEKMQFARLMDNPVVFSKPATLYSPRSTRRRPVQVSHPKVKTIIFRRPGNETHEVSSRALVLLRH
jgi:hypothetical protein